METIIQWILILAIAWFIVRRFMPVKGVSNISVQAVKDKFNNKNIQFIDVRTPGEYQARHQKPFKNMPLAQLAQQAKGLDQEKEVVVICQSGMRSMQACRILKKQGFDKVWNVTGGMSAWK